MSHSKKIIAATLAVVLLAATSAYAAENPDTPSNIDKRLGISNPDTPSEINQRIGVGDPVAGKDKSAFCQGCHGEDGNSATGAFPKLAGQWSDYIQKQFREFQNGARVNETMTDMAASVSEFQDVFDIAAYFASQKQMVGSPITRSHAYLPFSPRDNNWNPSSNLALIPRHRSDPIVLPLLRVFDFFALWELPTTTCSLSRGPARSPQPVARPHLAPSLW